MKWKNVSNPNITDEELMEHVNLIQSILLVYMHQNNLTELVAYPPDDLAGMKANLLVKQIARADGRVNLAIELEKEVSSSIN